MRRQCLRCLHRTCPARRYERFRYRRNGRHRRSPEDRSAISASGFVVQALTFSKLDASLIRNVGRDSFYANAKKCACRSGRNMSNSLCFVEYLFDVFGHVCDWWNACAGWIHKFAVCPEVKLSAMRAFGRNVLGIWICLKKSLTESLNSQSRYGFLSTILSPLYFLIIGISLI